MYSVDKENIIFNIPYVNYGLNLPLLPDTQKSKAEYVDINKMVINCSDGSKTTIDISSENDYGINRIIDECDKILNRTQNTIDILYEKKEFEKIQ